MKAPSKKLLMKKGTLWRATQCFVVDVLVSNPAHEKAMDRWRANGGVSKTGKTLEQASAGIPSRISMPLIEIQAGTELLVIDKQSSDWGAAYDGDPNQTNGTLIPFSFQKGECVVHRSTSQLRRGSRGWYDVAVDEQNGVLTTSLPFKQIEKYLEPASELKDQFIYVIRDSETGQYYRCPNHEYFEYVDNPAYVKWRHERDQVTGPHGPDFNRDAGYEWEKTNPHPSYGWYEPCPNVSPFVMEQKATKAKQHTDMGKVKTTILNFSGYFDGMIQDPDMPWFFQSAQSTSESRPYPFPASFEAVKMEKFSKNIVEVIDLQDWYARTWRLRGLTQTFGPTVRSLYNKIDKSGELGKWQYVVSFRVDGTEQTRLTAEHVKEIDDTLSQLNLAKTTKKTKDPYSISVLANSFSSALALKMGSNSLQSGIIDLKTMMEAVQPK